MRAAIKDGFTVGLGYIPLGLAYGMYLVSMGLHWWWAPISAFICYAGSMEFLMVGMITQGVGLLQVAAATFFVNFRHIFYGISFPLHLVKGTAARVYGVHALTDEAYAIVTSRPRSEMTGQRVFVTQVICHTFWVSGTTLGAAVGLHIPIDPQILAFVLTALFIVLAMDAWRANAHGKELLVALACALVALAIAPGQLMVVALSLYAVLLLIWAFAGRGAWHE